MSDQTEYLKVAEVAARFRVNPVTVYRLVEKGQLAAVRFGVGRKGIRIASAEVERYIADNLAVAV